MVGWKDLVKRLPQHRDLSWIIHIFASLGVLVCVITFTPVVTWWATYLAGPWNDSRGDVLIVLGGSPGSDGIMGESSYLRSQYSVLVYREGGFSRILLSGGGEPVPVASEMRDFLVSVGIPRAAISTEARSTSTRENALYAKQMLNGYSGRKVLLTSDFHMFRAYRAFRKVGLDIMPRPIPDVRKHATSWRGRWPAFLDLAEETIKIGYYYLRGWI